MAKVKDNDRKGPSLLAWSFTYQVTKETEDLPPGDLLANAFHKLGATLYAFQAERGEAGRLHYQGSVKFKHPVSGTDLRKAVKAAVRQPAPDEWLYYGAGSFTYRPSHNIEASVLYSLKEETRVEGAEPYLFPTDFYLGQDLYEYNEMYPWQQRIMDILKSEPHERDIHLICDPDGLSGKSTLAKTLGYKHGACIVPLGLTSAQMKSAIVGDGANKIYIIDLPRNNRSFVEIFDTIEEIKRGFVISCFHGKLNKLYMKRPHVVCFTNEWPDLSYLSFDMWQLYTISACDKRLVPRDKEWMAAKQREQKIINKQGERFGKGSLENS